MSARWLFQALSPRGQRARLSVFIFHRVRAERDPLFPGELDAARFENQMRWIDRWFNVLPLPEAVQRLQAGTLPAGAASITFDDGYADNCTVALPILQRAGVPATVFIATALLDGGRMWNDSVIEAVRRAATTELDLAGLGLGRVQVNSIEAKRAAIDLLLARLKYLPQRERETSVAAVAEAAGAALPVDLMLTTEQVQRLVAAGITIGAHTISHPILTRISDTEAKAEIQHSKTQLQSLTGRSIDLFAYPNGRPGRDYSSVHVRLVREAGYTAAFSTSPGAASAQSDPFQLPRFTPWDRSPFRYALRLANNLRRSQTDRTTHAADTA